MSVQDLASLSAGRNRIASECSRGDPASATCFSFVLCDRVGEAARIDFARRRAAAATTGVILPETDQPVTTDW